MMTMINKMMMMNHWRWLKWWLDFTFSRWGWTAFAALLRASFCSPTSGQNFILWHKNCQKITIFRFSKYCLFTLYCFRRVMHNHYFCGINFLVMFYLTGFNRCWTLLISMYLIFMQVVLSKWEIAFLKLLLPHSSSSADCVDKKLVRYLR